jgi:phosphate transport system substrate-binding protein
MQKPPYFWRSVVYLFVLLPLLFQIFALLVLLLAELTIDSSLGTAVLGIPVGAMFLLGCIHFGRRHARLKPRISRVGTDDDAQETPGAENPRFFVRYLPVVFAFGYTLIVALIALFLPIPTEDALFGKFATVFTLAHLPACFFTSILYLFSVPSPWFFLLPPLGIYAAYGCGLALGCRELDRARTTLAGPLTSAAVVAAVLILIVWRIDVMTTGFVRGGGHVAWITENSFNQNHHPFRADNTLVKIPSPTLSIERGHPRLDGATALYPIYAAAVQALYKNIDADSSWGVITSSTTPEAYNRLISGAADLVFVAQPSIEQRAAAEDAGRSLQLTPIAKEAFVFFVHKDNPVNGLTSDEIRAIYTKKITNWKQVGGRDEKILPYQRPQGSGSQTALELKVMKGEKLPAPLREEFAKGMGGVIQRVAAYRNSSEAIGYSFRVFATAMNVEKEMKLLSIDGVAPTREHIRSGTYPYTVDVYAVTAGTTNPHVPALVDWFLSSQGQQLIEETGYVRLRSVEEK